MIKDLKVNEVTTLCAVVMSAIAKETKAKKPYLQVDLFDGVDIIQGNYWDWSSGKIPDKNAIVDVKAQVTEYMGTKQLNIKSMSVNDTKHLSEFQPKACVKIDDTYKNAYELASSIKDDFLRSLTLAALDQLMPQWCHVPGAKGVHHAFIGGTLVHSLSVARIAKAISNEMPDSNSDLCIAGGLLHDIGKLFTYRVAGVSIDMTDEGMLYDHTFIGARFVSNFAEEFLKTPEDGMKLEMLTHIILSHHGVLEYGAAVPPMSIEAHIVNKADGIDASVQQILETSRKLGNVKFTDKIYTLGNRPQITPQYVQAVMVSTEEPV